ncbi:MAG: hypothetical protein CMO55_12585 [Verrucomicrobiales bacterium]|nr:hypothetical protein [Verrucomicrobiales bacterium]
MRFVLLTSMLLMIGSSPVRYAGGEELDTEILIVQENGGEWIYFPGREEPVGFPYNVFVDDQFVSSDGDVVVFFLVHARETLGEDFYGLLVCQRTGDDWDLEYKLFAADLYLKFGKGAWVDSIYDASNPRRAILKIATFEKRLPPSKVLRTWEVWDIVEERQIKVLGPAHVSASEPPEAIRQHAALNGE